MKQNKLINNMKKIITCIGWIIAIDYGDQLWKMNTLGSNSVKPGTWEKLSSNQIFEMFEILRKQNEQV